jgi:NADPH-dependent curcumin reductase CurA
MVLTNRPVGLPTEQDFETQEFDPGHPQSRQIAVSVRLLSLDPYMRGRLDARKSYATPTELGAVPPAQSIAVVRETADPRFEVGDLVLAPTGWATDAVVAADLARLVRDDDGVPASTALGLLGMPGFTAYAGCDSSETR